MSIRRLRQVLTYLTVILATVVATLLFHRYQQQEGLRAVAAQITTACQLPDVPKEIDVRHAHIDPSDDQQFIDVILTLSGPTGSLDEWLKQVDEWEKTRPGVIQNHRIREAEMSSRVDFTAEVYLK
ncbi:hypothetical protein N8485_04930 [Akkermansiaceae bacterium]|nr:hypothetical protein [Akkermansiaceae bacterium]